MRAVVACEAYPCWEGSIVSIVTFEVPPLDLLLFPSGAPPTMGIKVFEKNLAQGKEFCGTNHRFDSSNNPLNAPNIVLIWLSYYHI